MTGDLEQLLRNLKLTKVLEIYDETAQKAEEDGLSYADLFTRLLRAQWHARQDSALAWRVKQAALPQQWTLESFPFKLQPGVARRQILGLAELDFVAKAENPRRGSLKGAGRV
jgi:DNA replication protein DnaC